MAGVSFFGAMLSILMKFDFQGRISIAAGEGCKVMLLAAAAGCLLARLALRFLKDCRRPFQDDAS
jgi:hypothetical protein